MDLRPAGIRVHDMTINSELARAIVDDVGLDHGARRGKAESAVPGLNKRLIHETPVLAVDHAHNRTHVGRPLFCKVLRKEKMFSTTWPNSPSMSSAPPKPTCSR